jgi:hypothetical protein
MSNTAIHGKMTVEHQGKIETMPVYLQDQSDWLNPQLPSGTKIQHLELFEILPSPPLQKRGEEKQGQQRGGSNSQYEVLLFDVQSGQLSNRIDYKTLEWWAREEKFPVTVFPETTADLALEEGNVYFFPEESQKKWVFTFLEPDQEMIPALSAFRVPGPLPQPCRATLKINAQAINIPYGPYELPFVGFSQPITALTFDIEYLGDESFLVFQVPTLNVRGRYTPEDELKKLCLTIDGNEVPFQVPQLPLPASEWVDLGMVTLEEGEHVVQVENNPSFMFSTLILETETPLPWPETEQEQLEAPSLWKTMASFAAKFLVVVAVASGLYVFRKPCRKVLQLLFQPVRYVFNQLYLRLPNIVWTIIWAIIGANLYRWGWLHKTAEGDYGLTLGGLMMVLAFWHLSQLLKSRFIRWFPKLAPSVYRSRGAPFFAGAIVLLIVTAVLVAVKLDPVAEQTAIVVYYFLVLGAINEFVGLTL